MTDAQALLDEAMSTAKRPEGGFKSLVVSVYLNEAEMALAQRQFSEAKEKSQQVLSLAGTEYKEEAIEAKLTSGLALTLSGSEREGKQSCEEALQSASQTKNPWLISKAQLALAESLIESGDVEGALSNALAAEQVFARSGQQASEWRAFAVASRASRRANDEAKAREYAERATDVLSDLQKRWGADAYNLYLSRPDVQAARKQL
jgi:hypothetical protein